MNKPPLFEQPPLDIFDAIFGRSRAKAYIALGSRRLTKPRIGEGSEAPHWLIPVPVKDRHEWLPKIFEWRIENTQYLMQNTLANTALLRSAQAYHDSLLGENQPLYFRAMNEHVCELTAAVVDLDVGREGDITAGTALGAVFDMCLSEKIPWPSLAALSGRGCYLWWLLREDEQEVAPPLATEDNRLAWTLCVEKLLNYLMELKADKNAKRLANWFKRPGTLDTKTGKTVVYMTFGVNNLSNIPLYTLAALVKRLDVQLPQELPAPAGETEIEFDDTPVAPGHRTKHIRGGRSGKPRKGKPGQGGQPFRQRAREIESLSEYRGGLREGCRHMAIWHYFQAVRSYFCKLYREEGTARFNHAYREARVRAAKLNERFKPPLSRGELASACKATVSNLARNPTVVNDLMITKDEAVFLGFKSLLPTELVNEKYEQEQVAARARSDKRQRDAAVDAALKASTGKPALTALGNKYGVTKQFVRARYLRLVKRGELSSKPGLDLQLNN
jgi:hypothetical protein